MNSNIGPAGAGTGAAEANNGQATVADAARELLVLALLHMEAAIDLLDRSGAAPIGTAEHLDLAINNLAAKVDSSGEAQLRQFNRTADFGLGLDCP